MRSILITQCLQHDYLRRLGLREPLPSLVHVGGAEAERLLGASGALLGALEAAHAAEPGELGIVHLVDAHDPEADRAHFERFRPHCVRGSAGAGLVGRLGELAGRRPNTRVVPSTGLNDCEGSELPRVLAEMAGEDLGRLRVGVVGVWTDAKVAFLLYDLVTRLAVGEAATCSALVASRSNEGHFDELRRLELVLGVRVFHSAGSFLDWLGAPPPRLETATRPVFPLPAGCATEELNAERDALLASVLPADPGLDLRSLSGGFSGCQVLLARSPSGEAHIAKVGRRDEVARERYGNERVRDILGDTVPALVAHREGPHLAVMV